MVDFKLDSFDALKRALLKLHQTYGVPHVVISSIPISPDKAKWLPERFVVAQERLDEGIIYAAENLLCISSSWESATLTSVVHATTIPQVQGFFSGVGDLFSAVILGHYDPENVGAEDQLATPLSYAVTCAVRTTHAILRETARASALVPGAKLDGYTDEELDLKDENRRPRRMKARELRIIGPSSVDAIRSAGVEGAGAGFALEPLRPWKDFWK